MRNTSSTSIFDFRGRFFTDPSGGLVALCDGKVPIPDLQWIFILMALFAFATSFSSLNGVVAKDHNLNVCFWHSTF